MSKRFGEEYDPQQMVAIQMLSFEIQRQAMGRYLHDPANALSIEKAMGMCLAVLKMIFPGDARVCPPGSVHEKDCMCAVVSPPGDGERGRTWGDEEAWTQAMFKESKLFKYIFPR